LPPNPPLPLLDPKALPELFPPPPNVCAPVFIGAFPKVVGAPTFDPNVFALAPPVGAWDWPNPLTVPFPKPDAALEEPNAVVFELALFPNPLFPNPVDADDVSIPPIAPPPCALAADELPN